MKQDIKIITEFIKNREEFKKLRGKINYYSAEYLLSKGKEFIKDSKYLEADVIFDELTKVKGFGSLCELYHNMLSSISSIRFKEMVHSKGYDSEPIIENVVYCMTEATNMYADKEISKEDLFGIEELIDRIPFNKLTIKNREEFKKLYCRFKEYALDVFLENK